MVCLAPVVALLALIAPAGAAAPTTDPPFAASGYDASAIDEIWSSRDDSDRRFESKELVIPEELALVVAGYPGREGITLALERSSDSARLTLDAPEAGHAWQLVRFAIPRGWAGQRARIVASAERSQWWIGVTSPVKLERRWIDDLRIPLFSILCCTLLLLPGLAALALAGPVIDERARAALVVTASCLAGYVAFYVYFFSVTAGIVTSIGIFVASAAVIASSARNAEGRNLLRSNELRIPFALMLLYAVFVSALTFMRLPDWPDADEVVRNRYVRAMPGDNSLPQYLAENMWAGQDARRVIDGWLSSDRPPLQTGLTLLQRPLAEALGAQPSLFAQLGGIAAQATWVAGIWALCAAARFRRATLAVVMATAGMSGFFLLNTAFVWPKLLAGALSLVSIAALVASRREGWTTQRTVLAATSGCLAILSHAGAAFTILPAALLFATGRSRPSWRNALLAISIAASLAAPWMLYQRLYAPPGNRLLLDNIAGESVDRGRGFLEALVSNYRRIGAEAAIRGRFTNAALLLPDVAPETLANAEARRRSEWNRVFGTLGPLNLAWLLLIRRAFRRERSHDEVRLLYVVTAVSLAFPVAVLFGPREATAHTASYAAIATMFVLAANELCALPRQAVAAIVALQLAIFALDWIVLTPPGLHSSALPVASMPLALIALLAGAGFLAVSARLWRSSIAPAVEPERGYS